MSDPVYVTRLKKRYRICSSVVPELKPIIRELAAALLHGEYNRTERSYHLRMLKKLSYEAYANVVLIEPSLNMDKLEVRESEDWELHHHYYELEMDSLQTQYSERHKELDRRLRELDKAVDFYNQIKPITISSIKEIVYPEVPVDKISIRDPNSIPPISGVYFVWLHDLCEYVGQSKNLRNRVCSKHPKISIADKVSYLPFAESDLNFAESYYIGIMRPRRNFMTLEDRVNEQMDSTLLL
jgi:hypothetical protein